MQFEDGTGHKMGATLTALQRSHVDSSCSRRTKRRGSMLSLIAATLFVLLFFDMSSTFAAAAPEPSALIETVGDGGDIVEGAVGATGESFETSDSVNATGSRYELGKRAAGEATYYSALVAFGASYTDNAHTRSSAYSGSLRNYYPYAQYGGRYSNGPVSVEYMVNPTTSPALKTSGSNPVVLLDYAYGGSVIRNGLTGTSSPYPATYQQVNGYVSALNKSTINPGSGRVLHYFNTGINTVTQIWLTTLAANMTAKSVTVATGAITKNTQALGSYISTINTDAAVINKVHGADYLIVGIPPLEIVPTFGYQVPASYNASRKAEALNLLGTLTAQFNSEVQAFTSSFKSQVKAGSKVMYYDLASLWRSFSSSPSSYGIIASPITRTCYDSSSGAVCTNPSSYLYFDTLHPVTSIHKIWASQMNAVVNSALSAKRFRA